MPKAHAALRALTLAVGEWCFEVFSERFPDAPVFALPPPAAGGAA